jgi:hypothetical protein
MVSSLIASMLRPPVVVDDLDVVAVRIGYPP